MLYVTTRSNHDVYTAYRSLSADSTPDGGLFIPFQLPVFTREEVLQLTQKTPAQNIADILNLFFSTHLSGWDVDLCVGRNLINIVNLGQKIIAAEMWRNPASSFCYVVNSLYRQICTDSDREPSEWFQIAVRIAVVFGVFGQILSTEKEQLPDIDVSVEITDFSMALAVHYAKRMGLPIRTVIFCCDENSPVWDLLRRGECNTATVVENGNWIAAGLERLLCDMYGDTEAMKYRQALDNRGIYHIREDALPALRRNYFAAAISKARLDSVIRSVHRTDGYAIDARTARSFSGLQDYRASTGESRSAVLFVENAAKS